jgi:hypothetical protein
MENVFKCCRKTGIIMFTSGIVIGGMTVLGYFANESPKNQETTESEDKDELPYVTRDSTQNTVNTGPISDDIDLDKPKFDLFKPITDIKQFIGSNSVGVGIVLIVWYRNKIRYLISSSIKILFNILSNGVKRLFSEFIKFKNLYKNFTERLSQFSSSLPDLGINLNSVYDSMKFQFKKFDLYLAGKYEDLYRNSSFAKYLDELQNQYLNYTNENFYSATKLDEFIGKFTKYYNSKFTPSQIRDEIGMTLQELKNFRNKVTKEMLKYTKPPQSSESDSDSQKPEEPQVPMPKIFSFGTGEFSNQLIPVSPEQQKILEERDSKEEIDDEQKYSASVQFYNELMRIIRKLMGSILENTKIQNTVQELETVAEETETVIQESEEFKLEKQRILEEKRKLQQEQDNDLIREEPIVINEQTEAPINLVINEPSQLPIPEISDIEQPEIQESEDLDLLKDQQPTGSFSLMDKINNMLQTRRLKDMRIITTEDRVDYMKQMLETLKMPLTELPKNTQDTTVSVPDVIPINLPEKKEIPENMGKFLDMLNTKFVQRLQQIESTISQGIVNLSYKLDYLLYQKQMNASNYLSFEIDIKERIDMINNEDDLDVVIANIAQPFKNKFGRGFGKQNHNIKILNYMLILLAIVKFILKGNKFTVKDLLSIIDKYKIQIEFFEFQSLHSLFYDQRTLPALYEYTAKAFKIMLYYLPESSYDPIFEKSD